MGFVNANDAPLVPMVAVTGRPDRAWIHRRLAELRTAGIDQFLLYPRSGCELEYMSEEWLDTCDIFIQEGLKLGFHALWLYDEFNWPSGQCGGRVQAAHPDHAIQLMKFTPGRDGGAFEIISNPGFPNLLHPGAMELFITLTHEVYARRFGQYFGNFIKGIFTDEPSSGYGADYYGDGSGVKTIPYYAGLEEEYEKCWHVPFRQDIVSPRFAERCQQLVGRRFRENYLDRIRNWCEAHGLLLTGHLMEEGRIRNSRNHSGTPLRAIAGFSIPGLDEINTLLTPDKFEWLTFATAHYGIRQRGNGGLAELFALGPADMPLARMAGMMNMAALFGIDHYILAVSQLDFRGNTKKREWFNPYSADQPWWERHMPGLTERAREAAILARRPHAPEIGVRNPAGCVEITPLLKELVQHQLPWHLIDTDDPATAQETEIISVEAGIWTLERAGKHFPTYGALVTYLSRNTLRDISLWDGEELAKDVFLRVFADGSAMLQDLTDQTALRRLTLRRSGGAREIELWGRGCYEIPAWKVYRDRPNRLRVQFHADGAFTFAAAVPMTVTLAVRAYEFCRVELDGVTLAPEKAATELPPGFEGLYRSITLDVAAGNHTMRLTEGQDCYPYLPSCWISGDFAVSGTTLSEDLQNGEGLESYAGCLTQKGTLVIPRNVAGFYLETGGLPAEVLLDGESLGSCEVAPFFWSIPEKFRGKRLTMEIRRYTSIGPAFGSATTFVKHNIWVSDLYSGQYPVNDFILDPEFRYL